tara:strand:- start:12478 stop:14940 length:2463 start_codon:yes stop_codon:yes gene_type:complete
MGTNKTLSVFLKLNSKAFTSGIKRVEGKLNRFSKQLGSIGSSLTTGVSMPLLGIGAAAVKTASEFDASMTKINTLVGTSAEEVAQLRDSVLDLAGETATAPKELAEGLFFIQSAGFKGAEGLEALEVSAKAAAIGMGDMTSISNALTSIMTGYADSGMTATKAGDLLHETLKQGKFEAGQFMDKLGSVIPTAAAFGISFEQLGASVATMSKLSGDAAGSLTAVNRLMLSLNAPAEQQSKILNKVFGSYENLSKGLKSDFMGTLKQIFTALEGNDQELIKVFGSAKAVQAAFATAGLQGETYTEVLDGMYKSQGNIAQGFDTVSDESAFKFKQALSDLTAAGIELGTTLMPIATKIAETFSNMANKFSSLSQESRDKIVKLGMALVALGPTLMIISKFVAGFSMMIKAIRVARVAAIAFGKSMFLISGIGTVIAGIVVAIGFIVKHWEIVKEKIVGVINYVIDLYNESQAVKVAIEFIGFAFQAVWEFFKLGIKNIVSLFKGLGNVIVAALDPRKSVKDAFNDMVSDIEGNVLGFADKIVENYDKAKSNIDSKEPIEFITAEDLENKGKELVNGVKKIAGDMAGAVEGVFDGLLDGGGGGDLSFNPGDTPTYNADSGGGSGGDSGGDNSGGGSSFGEKFQEHLDSISDGWSETITQMEEQASNFMSDFGEGFADMVATTIVEGGSLKDAFKGFINAMIQEVIRLIVKMTVMKGLMAIINPGGGLLSGAGGLLKGIGKGIGKIFGFAEGGMVVGPTLAMVGEGAGTNISNPEVIIPLDKLRNMIGNTGTGRLHGSISGSDILLSNQRSSMSQDRVSGSVTDF